MPGLIFDTSTQSLLLAIAEGQNILMSQVIEGGKNLSKSLFPALQSLLLEYHLQIKNLDYIAVGVGPGSYMGIRSAAIIAKTFSFVHNLPLVSFTSPLAFIPKIEGRFAFIDDAKMDQLFLIKGTYVNDTLLHVTSPFLIEKNQYPLHLGETDVLVTSLPLKETSLPTYSPTLNFPLLAKITFQNFTTKTSNDLELIYLR